MKTMKYSEIEPVMIDNDVAKGIAARVLIGKDDGADNFCMRAFELSKGGHTPCHSHEWEHEIFIHAGTGKVLLGDEWKPVSAGSVIYIPGNTEHQMKNTGEETFVAICLVPAGAPEL